MRISLGRQTQGLRLERVAIRGFTLVEMLVALSIFALLAALAYGGLAAIVDQSQALNERMARWAALEATMAAFEDDWAMRVDRPVRDALGASQPAFVGQAEDGALLKLSRRADVDALTQGRTWPLRVEFRWVGGDLVRDRFLTLDRKQGDEPQRQLLLPGVERVALRFRARGGQWQQQWPPDGAGLAAHYPDIVELRLVVPPWGEIVRRFGR